MKTPSNRVLTSDAHTSNNFFESDQILHHYLKKHLTGSAFEYISDKLMELGEKAAVEMDHLSLKADQQPPELKCRTKFGEKNFSVNFHPAYEQLLEIAARSEMFFVKYDPKTRKQFLNSRHKLGFAAGHLYAMSELGVYCPLCMTDGATHLVDRYAPDELRERLLPRLSAREGNQLYTGAMFLTEKSGGSDVGRNLCTAKKIEGNKYELSGEKWFCSNVNADVIMALARTDGIDKGTRGLSLFLIEKTLPGGQRNPMKILRLKDKMGVRSMATGEVEFNNTVGIRLGEENRGFKLMAEMINISRLYNSVAATAGSRRAIIEAWQYLNHRIAFGKKTVEHALVRQKFRELGSLYLGDFLLVWRAIRAMDKAEKGEDTARHLLRMIIPMAKWRSAEHSVYITRECMELMGGNGYIEEFVMPKLLRDVNVLPIWEGSGNIIVLDILRAAKKSEGLELVIKQIRNSAEISENYGELMQAKLESLLALWQKLQESDDKDVIESTAKPLFKELIRLYQMALMIEESDDTCKKWINPALEYYAATFSGTIQLRKPLELQRITDLIGWEY